MSLKRVLRICGAKGDGINKKMSKIIWPNTLEHMLSEQSNP